jgi:hypothetical protein
MKTATKSTRRAARPRVFNPARHVFLDVHPNVTIAHTGDASAPLFRQLNGSDHGMDRAAVAIVLASGLKSSGFNVTPREFDAEGKPL